VKVVLASQKPARVVLSRHQGSVFSNRPFKFRKGGPMDFLEMIARQFMPGPLGLATNRPPGITWLLRHQDQAFAFFNNYVTAAKALASVKTALVGGHYVDLIASLSRSAKEADELLDRCNDMLGTVLPPGVAVAEELCPEEETEALQDRRVYTALAHWAEATNQLLTLYPASIARLRVCIEQVQMGSRRGDYPNLEQFFLLLSLDYGCTMLYTVQQRDMDSQW